jgi:hypothetical protein
MSSEQSAEGGAGDVNALTPPSDDSDDEVRPPRKIWYAIGGIVAAIGLVGGATLFGVLLVHLLNRGPVDDHAFGNNSATTVHIDAGESKTVYVTPTAAYGYITCTARDDKGKKTADLIPYSSRLTFNQWRAAFTLSPPHDGDFMISCLGPADARYGIADHIGVVEFASPAVAAGVGLVVFVAGVVVVIATAVRRVRAKPKPQSVPPESGAESEAT